MINPKHNRKLDQRTCPYLNTYLLFECNFQLVSSFPLRSESNAPVDPSDLPVTPSRNETFEGQLGEMIANSPLEQLIIQHKELSTDMGVLDSELQTLIYENYSKFILATDTVRSIGKAVADLNGKFNDLEELIGGVVSQSEAVNGKLEMRQGTILELTETRSLLQRLQALLDIPLKINAAIAQGYYDVAAECIVEVAPVLGRHGHRKALKPVADEVESKRVEIVNKLRHDMQTRPECAADSLSLLLKLGESAEKLQGEYLQQQRTKLQTAFASALGCQEESMVESLSKLDASIVEQISVTEELFALVFIDKSNFTVEIRDWLQLWMTAVQNCLKRIGDGRIRSATGFDEKGSINTSFTEFGFDWGTKELVMGLEKVRSDTLPLESQFVELAIGDKVSQLVGDMARYHIKHSFDAFEARLLLEVCNSSLGSQVKDRVQVNQDFDTLKATALSGIHCLLDGMRPLAANVLMLDGWQEVVALFLQSQTAQFFQTLPPRLVRLAKLEPESAQGWDLRITDPQFIPGLQLDGIHADPLLLLALSVLCSFVQQTLANKTLEFFNNSFSATDAPFVIDTNSAEKCASQLFLAYTSRMSDRLIEVALTCADEDWSSHPDPGAPRKKCIAFLELIMDINTDFQALEQSNGAGEVEKHWHQHSASSTSIDSVSKPSTQPKVVSSKVMMLPWTSRMQVTSSLADGALRRFAEALKGYDFSKGGFQQIQIDCHYYRTNLRKLYHGGFAEKLFATLEEIVLIAAERCAEPVLLEPALLDKRVMLP